ncbi:STE3-domain-containing protein [Schizopora paradoxa]|uniref:STE3-domain-containing protein n=1 Tax=Schizopora paradoxa TaxID=27342 RepID=A0A0H2RWW5_9AGAM|nr:STE3-domain-containing protein [Schizopora paradoxa]
MSFASDPTYPLFPTFAFLGFFLVLIPLPWHFQAWNAGTCLYMVWTALACLNQFINSLAWRDSAINFAPVWCDISSRLITGVAVAIPAASLCINRRLYKIASIQCVSVTRAQKRRAVIEDLSIGLGIPIIEMALAYVVNGHRFDIYEGLGCYPAIYNVWLSYVLVSGWPIAIGLVSACYCVLSLRAFHQKRSQFRELLSQNKSLTVNRYFRLMALATIELICTIPFATYFIIINSSGGQVFPYKGWADLHFHWSFVGQFPATLWRLDHKAEIALELTRWLVVVCAFVFFAFFGFADEARRNYKRVITSALESRFVRKLVPRIRSKSDATKLSPNNSRGVLPVFINRPPIHIEKKISMISDSSLTKASLSPSSSTNVSFEEETKVSYDECYGHAY